MKGGVALSQENSSILRFSLEESVWFQKGQEVDDLLSISLDPNITIQENDQYITIQGSLELTGEYNRTQTNQPEEEEVFKAPKLVHSVLEREEGVNEFLHHFPVDITIPFSRVSSIDDIVVEIETFDYVFPERSCLNLTAELSIAGLTNEEQAAEEEVNEDEWTSYYPGREEKADNTEAEQVFVQPENDQEDELEALTRGYGVRQNPEEEVELTAGTSSREDVDFGVAEVKIENQPVFRESEEEQEHVEIEVQPFQRISPLMEEEERISAESGIEEYEPFELEVRKAPPQKDEDWEEEDNTSDVPLFAEADVIEEPPAVLAEPIADNKPEVKVSLFRAEEETFPAENVFDKPVPESSEQKLDESTAEYSEHEKDELDESSSESDNGPKKKKGIFAKKKTLTFTEFFARKEEETHTKLKVVIVQQGDTIEKLSERYNVNVHNLLKENHLEVNQDVVEGQVLYIPSKFAEK